MLQIACISGHVGQGVGYFRSTTLDQIATWQVVRQFTRVAECSANGRAVQPQGSLADKRFVSRVGPAQPGPIPGPRSTGVNCCELRGGMQICDL